MSELIEKNKAILRAEILIHTSIELYNSKNYICAVPLAAAADDSLGKQLIAENRDTALYALQDFLKKEHSLEKVDCNSFVNSIKHGRKYTFEETEENSLKEGIHFILRAINNYLECKGTITNLMYTFFQKEALPLLEDKAA